MYSRMPKRPYVSMGNSVSSQRSVGERLMDRGVYIPPNYSGTAIDPQPQPTPHFEDLPQVSNLPQPTIPQEAFMYDEPEGEPYPYEEPAQPAIPVTTSQETVGQGSFWGSLFGSGHFPFGHGLGYEELFLLGLLLFLMHEDSQENREESDLPLTLLLVGALLFCG